MKNELIWLKTECVGKGFTMQPVLVNSTLWYTLYDSQGYVSVFSTVLGLHMFLNGNTSVRTAYFETEEGMVRYLEECR